MLFKKIHNAVRSFLTILRYICPDTQDVSSRAAGNSIVHALSRACLAALPSRFTSSARLERVSSE